jgi:alanyl-tRNA synthetase
LDKLDVCFFGSYRLPRQLIAMMTSSQIRTSSQVRKDFLDFFKSKQHTIVPSSSLMPDSPNLLFTNAGMNQFVPIFLGQTKCPYTPGRAADTQKCIRAGGKHNDLDDVGLDTYHHTFFEMLGNWSFGDYFKKEAIEWAWELVVNVWKFPPTRLYATIYNPDKSKNDPSDRDEEAWNFWAEKFRSVGLDPAVHIVNGNKKDNFWMMGETGPCGPCSELHVDLTPAGDTKGSLVNKGDARCIEIWNLVFIQFNANPDGTFSPLPAKHVDTGMGFERVTSIIQGTKNLTDFKNAKISNYETDIFRPIFDALEKLSGKRYTSTLPGSASAPASSEPLKTVGEAPGGIVEISGDKICQSGGISTLPTQNVPPLPSRTSKEQEAIDIAFRVIADHIRTLSFAIADGIQPGNTDRNYVLRRILRRAVRYGRTLGFKEPFFYKLVDVLADTMGDVFPEIRARRDHVEEVIKREEEAFNKTLDTGIDRFQLLVGTIEKIGQILKGQVVPSKEILVQFRNENPFSCQIGFDFVLQGGVVEENEEEIFFIERTFFIQKLLELRGKRSALEKIDQLFNQIPGYEAFKLYDTYGFPLDLTELMARERGLTVDKEGFEKLMEEQRARARAAQKKEVIKLTEIQTNAQTTFIGYEQQESKAKVLEVHETDDAQIVITDKSPFYVEMGGQVGDSGYLQFHGERPLISKLQKIGHAQALIFPKGAFEFMEGADTFPSGFNSLIGQEVVLHVGSSRRAAIQRHHTVTHLLHWALHEVASREASQKGSFVGPDKLTFDFNSQPLTPQQIADIEKLVNERILENAGVSWTEVPYAEVKSRKDVMQFFGDKYGDTVRVVQIGGHAQALDGYSMELCGGTHTRATGEIGLFRIVGESAIAAGVRRIEAVAGLEAYRKATDEVSLIKALAGKVNAPIHELDKKIDALLAHQKELEKQVKAAQQREASNVASNLKERVATINGVSAIIHNVGGVDGDFLQAVADAIKASFKGVIVLGGSANGSVALIAAVSSDFTAKIQAGKIIQQIAPIVGGKGGGKPDNARGGGKDASKLDEALAKARSLIQ